MDSDAALATLSTIGAFIFNASLPLFFELAIEVAFPVPEGLVGSALGITMNVFGFCVLFLVTYVDAGVMNWLNFGVVFGWGLLLLLLLKEKYIRADVDELVTKEENEKLIQVVN